MAAPFTPPIGNKSTNYQPHQYKYECHWSGCERRFVCPHNVLQHVREKHLHVKPFACVRCHAAFARPASLYRHERDVHKFQRPKSEMGRKRKGGDEDDEEEGGDGMEVVVPVKRRKRAMRVPMVKEAEEAEEKADEEANEETKDQPFYADVLFGAPDNPPDPYAQQSPVIDPDLLALKPIIEYNNANRQPQEEINPADHFRPNPYPTASAYGYVPDDSSQYLHLDPSLTADATFDLGVLSTPKKAHIPYRRLEQYRTSDGEYGLHYLSSPKKIHNVDNIPARKEVRSNFNGFPRLEKTNDFNFLSRPKKTSDPDYRQPREGYQPPNTTDSSRDTFTINNTTHLPRPDLTDFLAPDFRPPTPNPFNPTTDPIIFEPPDGTLIPLSPDFEPLTFGPPDEGPDIPAAVAPATDAPAAVDAPPLLQENECLFCHMVFSDRAAMATHYHGHGMTPFAGCACAACRLLFHGVGREGRREGVDGGLRNGAEIGGGGSGRGFEGYEGFFGDVVDLAREGGMTAGDVAYVDDDDDAASWETISEDGEPATAADKSMEDVVQERDGQAHEE